MNSIWLHLFIPAMLANGSPPIIAKLLPNFLDFPVDFNKSIKGKRIFGDHKTVRGFVIGVLLAQIVFFLQYEYISQYVPLYFGGLVGFTVLFFDSLKSFFKRQIDIKSGDTWFPFDQLDWIIGYLLILNIYISTTLTVNIMYIIVGFLLHIISKVVGYFLKINEKYI